MPDEQALALARATEDPDTDIHSQMSFELDQTWSYPSSQKNIHSLTGGYHGVEEFITAMKFLFTPSSDVSELGRILHRYGDTYAHTKLDALKPSDLFRYHLAAGSKNEEVAIKSWEGMGTKRISDDIEPWIGFINNYVRLYGIAFLTDITLQKKHLYGKTLSSYLHDVYMTKKGDKFSMYGGNYFTVQHALIDGSYPDKIYIRPDWYLNYVENLAWLIASKYNLNVDDLEIEVFKKMVNFVKLNKCSMRGIIDYEIAKKRDVNYIFVPVFYSNPWRVAASIDALINTNYYSEALKSTKLTVQYIRQDGRICEEPEAQRTWNIKFSIKEGFFNTEAFKLVFL